MFPFTVRQQHITRGWHSQANSYASLNMKERSSDFKTLQNYLLQKGFLDLCSLKGRLCRKNTYVKIKHILVNKNNLKEKSN